MIGPGEQQLPLVINGREYPMWSQFVHKKNEWIGGVLEDSGDSLDRRMNLQMGRPLPATTITDIDLAPNGNDSAFFMVYGTDFNCGFDVKFGGISAGEPDWLTFSGYGGHTWRIKKPDQKKPEEPQLL